MTEDRWAFEIEYERWDEQTGDWQPAMTGVGEVFHAAAVALALEQAGSAQYRNVVLIDAEAGRTFDVSEGHFVLRELREEDALPRAA